MSVGLLLFPLFSTILFAIVARKAGFGWVGLLLALGPLAGPAFAMVSMSMMINGMVGPDNATYFSFIPLISQVLQFAPLLMLAFVKWPALAQKRVSSED